MSDVTLIAIVVGALALAGLAVWGVLRWRYVQSLKAHGWQFETSPSIQHVVGLNHPPFGSGFRRRVDDMVHGTSTSGWAFKALEYDHDGWRSDHYVVILPLPRPLPHLHARAHGRPGRVPALPGASTRTVGNCTVHAEDARFADALAPVLAELVPELGHEVTIDHARLVVLDVPAKADALYAAVETGARLAEAVSRAADGFAAPDAPGHLSFTHRPDWVYIPRDDSWLARVPYTRGGHSHEAWDIVHGERDGIGFVRLEHRWKTTHRDKDGRTHTRNHTEYLCPFHVTFPFGALDLGSNPLGIANDRSGLQFESSQFNEAYKVTAADKKFAYDVLHPRMMHWLLERGAPRVHIRTNGHVRIPEGGRWGVAELEAADDFLREFFARVPDFVWQNLGVWPRPVPEAEVRTP
ncbi:hypothetical protein [Tessaracoccus oleiagri]|uniref:DUF3137 domain-containing protein n=1 Tax=Tessaracoccus oleiagri TaxID=686624 RepID=A0A1G9KZS2_9ACTN|nr:hypothetical protein [Tessaracoccus oleiagri]SDL55360.1 hypothetical protein SAMN04488242_1921 [Tessaracoccus oleiagri]